MLYPKIAFVNVTLVARVRHAGESRVAAHADTPNEIPRLFARALVNSLFTLSPPRV